MVKILVDSHSFLGDYNSEYTDAFEDALQQTVECYQQYYPNHKFTSFDFNCYYDEYIKEIAVRFINEIGSKDHIKISEDDLFSTMHTISFKLPNYTLRRINNSVITNDTLYYYFYELCRQRNITNKLDCNNEYDYWVCGPEVCGALFDTYFADEIEDFNNDIKKIYSRPFKIAMQYIKLKS